MKRFQLRRGVGVRAFTSNYAFNPRRINVPTSCSVRMTSVRKQSSAKKPSRLVKWTEYPLDRPTASVIEADFLSKASKDASAVHTAYIALGSNLGGRVKWIEKACKQLSARGIKVKRTSCLWETEPMYVANQENFVNGACEASFGLLSNARASSGQ